MKIQLSPQIILFMVGILIETNQFNTNFMNLVAMIWEKGKLIVKLYLNILQNDLLKNIY